MAPFPGSGSNGHALKLAAGPAFRMPDLSQLGADLVVTELAPERTTTTYMDTGDLRLARAGAGLRFRSDAGWIVTLPADVEAEAPLTAALTFDGDSSAPPNEAGDLVSGYVRTADVGPVARLSTVRRRVLLDDAEGARLLEVDDDEVSVLASGNRIAARFREIEVDRSEQAPAGLADAVLYLLREAGAGDPDVLSNAERALGPRAMQAPDVTVESLGRNPSAVAVIRRSLAGSVAHLQRFDPIARLDRDMEGVHQMRVACARMRAHLRTFASWLDPEWTTSLRAELTWLGQVLGANRDADVMLERLRELSDRLPDPALATPLIGALAAERAAAHAAVLDTLRGARYLSLLDRLVDAARSPSVLPEVGDLPASVLAAGAQQQWEALRGRVKRSGKEPTDDALHRVRVHAKRARYAAEALDVVGGKRAKVFATSAAGVQTVLGEHQDAIVMRNWLNEHALASGDLATAFVAGELAGLEVARASQARRQWRKSWKRLRQNETPDRWA